MNKGVAALCALMAGCSFGFGGALSQIIRSFGFEVMHVVLGQAVAGVAILGVLLVIRRDRRIPRFDIVKLVFIGIMSALASICYFFAIDMISVGATVAIQFQYVWIVVLLVSIADRKAPGAWTFASAVLIVVGSILGSGMADELLAGQLTMDPLGLILALGCALFYALALFLNGRVALEFESVPRAFYQACGSLLTVVVTALVMGTPSCDVVQLAPWGVAMGLVMCVIPVLSIVKASTVIDGGLVSILTSSELPMAVLSGYLLLGEVVTPLVVIGVVIIVGSIAMAQLDNRGKKAEGAR